MKGQSIDIMALRRYIVGLMPSKPFYQIAPESAAFPYLVIDLISGYNNGDSEAFVLDVDGWDDSADTSALEAMMKSADDALDSTSGTADGKAVAIWRDSRLSIPDPETRIKRRKYTYQIKVY